ncbi:MAG: SDR family NAD(P)-dependent oxidoreductase [Gammaproteobacteria bacterium]|nr:SDR family NAD(P)-dependent oxidoreductase [Gammaproteobacteria bacterium]
MDKKRIVIIGATSAIAEHCARLWAQTNLIDITLVGRDTSRIERIAKDLQVRSPQSEIHIVKTGFIEPNVIQSTADNIFASGPVDIVLIAHGTLPDQIDCQNNLSTTHDALEINGVSPALYAEAFARHMAVANLGTLAIIGSVAGDRGRKSNYVYGAAKGLITRYAQGLQHRFAGTGVKVVLIKPGPTDTPMTAHLKNQGAKLTSVESVAKNIVKAIEHGKATAYVPCKWQIIMLIIRHLPAFIFNKLNI